MSAGLNRVMLLGNLGADPELRYTKGGQAILHIRLATTESYLAEGNPGEGKVWRERTDWHNVVVWGKRGEALGTILTKGSSIFVEGSLRTSSYDDREGQKRYKTEVIANNVLLAGGGKGGRGRASGDEAGDMASQGGGEDCRRGGSDEEPPIDYGGGHDDIPF